MSSWQEGKVYENPIDQQDRSDYNKLDIAEMDSNVEVSEA